MKMLKIILMSMLSMILLSLNSVKASDIGTKELSDSIVYLIEDQKKLNSDVEKLSKSFEEKVEGVATKEELKLIEAQMDELKDKLDFNSAKLVALESLVKENAKLIKDNTVRFEFIHDQLKSLSTKK